MNLLPKTSQEFGQSDYWNAFFKKRGKKAFEWYGEYPELCDQLHKYIKPKDSILMAGCGNSKLSMDMYDIGLKDITNIDISQVVIKQMIEINKKQRPDLRYIQMDATAMTFPEESFSVVLDKGTLDALMTEDNKEVLATAQKYCSEIARVLKNGGRYICISLLQKHILKFLLDYFPASGFMFRIVRCFEAEAKTAETSTDGNAMPVFIVIASKFRNLPQKILEVCLGGDKMQRLQSTEELFEAITSTQKASMVCNGLGRSNISGLNEVCITLFQPGSDDPRYTVYVLDQPPARGHIKYAAFIVPQGREVEWLFTTPQGRKKLLETASCSRLAIVTMHRNQKYSDLESVKSELTESVRSFAPNDLKEQIPFLSLGSDVGNRQILHKGHSEFSGDFIVEEVEGDGSKLFRRLIFLSNQSVVQSEALIKTVKSKNGTPKKKVDLGYLACQHHLYMSIGAHYATIRREKPVLVIGLGGGCLCNFLRVVIPEDSKVIGVEIDASMLKVAEEFFELKRDDRLQVEIKDGITYIEAAAQSGRQFSAILFDVDSKDLSLGMSCPPKNFLDSPVLENVKNSIGNDGLFILNLVCRDEVLRADVLANLKNVFKSVCSYKLEEDVNEVIYCANHEIVSWLKVLDKASKEIYQKLKQQKLSNDDLGDVTEFLRNLIV